MRRSAITLLVCLFFAAGLGSASDCRTSGETEWAVMSYSQKELMTRGQAGIHVLSASSPCAGQMAVKETLDMVCERLPKGKDAKVPDASENRFFVKLGNGGQPANASLEFKSKDFPAPTPHGERYYFRITTNPLGQILKVETLYSTDQSLNSHCAEFLKENVSVTTAERRAVVLYGSIGIHDGAISGWTASAMYL